MFEIMSIKGGVPVYSESGGHKQVRRSPLIYCYSNGEFEINVDEFFRSNDEIDISNFYFSDSDFRYFEKVGVNGVYYYDDGKSVFTRGDNILIEEIGLFLPFSEIVLTDFPVGILAIDGDEQIQELFRVELIPNKFIKLDYFLENVKNRSKTFKLYGFVYASENDIDLCHIKVNRTVGGFFVSSVNDYLQNNLLEARMIIKIKHNYVLEYNEVEEIVI